MSNFLSERYEQKCKYGWHEPQDLGIPPQHYKAVRPKRKFKKIVEAAAKTLISAGLAMQDFLTDLTIARTGVWQPSKAWTYYFTTFKTQKNINCSTGLEGHPPKQESRKTP